MCVCTYQIIILKLENIFLTEETSASDAAATPPVKKEKKVNPNQEPETSLWDGVRGMVLESGQEDKGAPSVLNEYFPGVPYTVDKVVFLEQQKMSVPFN